MTGVDVSVSLGSTSSSDTSSQTISAGGTGVFNNFNNDLTAPLNSQNTNYTVTVSYVEGNDITFDVPVEVGDTGAGSGTVTYQVDGDSQAIYYQGQDVNATGLDSETEYTLRQVDEFDGQEITSSSFEAEYTPNESGFIDLDTSDLESGDYFLRGGDLAETRDNSFELTVQDFSAEWEDDSYDNGETEAELTTESQRNSYNVIISADGLDYDDLEALFAGDNSPVGDVAIDDNADDDEIIVEGFRDDEIIANFSNTSIDSGDYEFDLEVKDTEATDTASVTVQEEDVTANFNESITTAAAGDVVEVTVELEDTDEAYIGIGDGEVGFFDVVRVEDDDDDDEATFQINTRTLGTAQSDDAYQSGDDIVERNPDEASYEDEDDGSFDGLQDFRANGLEVATLLRPAQPGEYEMVATADGEFAINEDDELTVDNELDLATLDLVEPTIDGVTVHTAPAGDSDEADDVEALLEDVTPSETVAIDDRMVIQVEADGVEGFVAENTSADLDSLNEGVSGEGLQNLIDNDFEGVNFDVESVSATANQEGAELDFSDTTVYFADGQFFVVVDTSEDDAGFSQSIEDGDEFDVTYEYVTDEDDRYEFGTGDDQYDVGDTEDAFPYFSADESASAEASFTLEDRDATFDNTNADGDVEIANSEEAAITGTTNVAPGTEVSVRVRSASGVSPGFILTDDDAEVSEDGSFEATIDTTEGEVGDDATVNFRVSGSSIADEDAVLVEQTQEPATFEVSDLSPQEATASAGDSVTVSATIENTGGAEGTQSVALTLDGEELDSQEVTLGAGNSTTVEFTADTSGLDAGDYEHGVATDDDEATGTLTIEADGGMDGDDGEDGTDGEDGEDGTDGEDGEDGTDGEDGGDGGTDDSTPGFGALVALVALIAAALLATRRTE
ncbi:hypothetical protein DJ73_03880 [Halorubrum sp. Ea1]|nr:hypothetical protein DJ73_03880 [Halorubrum sp. Ea1]